MKNEQSQPNNPLHGIKLADIVNELVEQFGWETLGQKIKIKCFNNNPSIKSSLTFLRKTDWARKEVEALYLKTIIKNNNNSNRPTQSKAAQSNISSKGSARKFGRK
ncbi:MAG: DUF2132 domain-containing protein [Saprospiraceae bacterium]|nr:VF530 family protein [Bacteroidia bacterium]NNE15867.1 DUF2132 domain-containing protein [Saprospiraceae bacterium]NNL92114.1 DUF2132 domain-containing protein [Saprospiraceae bacterium]